MGASSGASAPLSVMATLGEELEGWDELDEDERERIRVLLRDLGLHLDVAEDPDAIE